MPTGSQRRNLVLFAVVTVVAVVVVTVGCGPGRSAEPSIPADKTWRHDGRFFPPIDAAFGKVDVTKLQATQNRVWVSTVESCMQDRGFGEFRLPPSFSLPPPSPALDDGQPETEPSSAPTGRGWGIVDSAVRSYTGSSLPGDTTVRSAPPESLPPPQTTSGDLGGLTDDEMRTMAESCTDPARRAVDAVVPSPTWVAVSEELSGLHEAARRDSRWTALNDEWTACMRTAGVVDLGDGPDDVTAAITSRLEDIGRWVVLQNRAPTSEELDAAESLAAAEQQRYDQDRVCRTQTSLVSRRNDIVAAYQIAWLQDHPDVAARIRAEVDEFNRST